jgi:hypothetical protein
MVFIAGIPEERIQLSLRRTVVFVAGILEKMIELSLRKLEGFLPVTISPMTVTRYNKRVLQEHRWKRKGSRTGRRTGRRGRKADVVHNSLPIHKHS